MMLMYNELAVHGQAQYTKLYLDLLNQKLSLFVPQ